MSDTAILLINLGTPEAATAPAVRRYLAEFLSDPRVVELPRVLWWPVLHGIVLRTRPKKSAAKYAAIWTPEGSPLKAITERQTKLLRGFLGQDACPVRVEYAMRYGQPSIPSVLDRLHADGFRRLLILPLYPQYSASTTATAFDTVFAWCKTQRNQPEIHTVRHFADDPGYLAALAARVRQHWKTHGQLGPNDRLLLSFHGIPERCVERGDPYRDDCETTARLLGEVLGLEPGKMVLCYQSRFGRAKWLTPDTAGTLRTLARQGIQRVDALCPGFTADCLETLEEIAIEGKSTFLAEGGREFSYIPCLNDSDAWIRALADLARKHLTAWI